MTAFIDGSNQQEKTQVTTLDRFKSEPYKLSEHNLKLALFTDPPLPPTIGQFKV